MDKKMLIGKEIARMEGYMWERKDGFLYTHDWGVEMIEVMMNEDRDLEKDKVRREKDLEIQWKDSTTREAKYNKIHKE